GASAHAVFYAGTLRPTVFVLAAEKGHDEVMQILIARGGMRQSSEIEKALSHSASGSNSKCLEIMLTAFSEIIDKKMKGRSLLSASIHGQVKNVELLLQHGANKDFQNEEGKTVLHCAAKYGEG